jgi:hypothetical protein
VSDGPGPEGGDPACWAHEFEELLFGEPDEPDEGDEGDPDDPATR